MLKAYYQLTKPGIIYGNGLTTFAGFLLAAHGHINIYLLVETLLSSSLIIAAGCVFNNYIDRNLDSKMNRTKKRGLVTGNIKTNSAIIFGTVLTILGFFLLNLFTNKLTVIIGAVGFFDYVVLYGLSKRRSTLGTLVGSVAGSTPILAGYTAASNSFDWGAILVFLILAFWQMSHFYAIAIYRLEDYKNAGLPVLPAVSSVFNTKVQILLYGLAFGITSFFLTFLGYTGISFLVTMIGLVLFWLGWGIKNFNSGNDNAWARKMFLLSLVVLTSLSVILSVSSYLP